MKIDSTRGARPAMGARPCGLAACGNAPRRVLRLAVGAARPLLRAGALARRVLACLLAAALACACLPASAFAAPAGGNSLEGEVGIKLDVPAGTSAEAREESGSIGVRLTIPPAGSDEPREVAGDVGIRLTVPAADADEPREVEGSVGIRLAVPPADADEPREVEGSVGIRLAVPAADADEPREVTGDVGIRLTVPPESTEGPREVTGDIGVRLTVPATYTVTFDAAGGTFASNGTGRKAVEVAAGSSVAEALGISGAADLEAPEGDRLFLGWFSDEACIAPYNPTDRVAANITVWAGWSDIVDVRYHANYGKFAGLGGGSLEKVPYDATDSAADPGDKTAGGYLIWRQARPGVDVHDLPSMTDRPGARFLGWWTRGEGGVWLAEVADGSGVGEETPDAAAASGGAIDLWPRWAAESVRVLFDDGVGDAEAAEAGPVTEWPMLDGSGTAGTQAGTWLAYGEAPTAAISPEPDPAAGDLKLAPVRPGHTLAGFWWESADGKSDVLYYGASYPSAEDVPEGMSGRLVEWSAGPEVAGGWARPEHAVDRLRADGAAGEDGIADTLVLTARWDVAMRATVPVSLSFAVEQFGDERPKAEGPSMDAFAIKNYTPAALRVDSVRAEADDAGLCSVLYTHAPTRKLYYPGLGGDVRLTLDPEGDSSDRLAFAIAGIMGPDEAGTTKAAGPLFKLTPWRPTGGGDDEKAESPGELHVLFGLDLPPGARAQASGATGEIARVQFTLSLRQ